MLSESSLALSGRVPVAIYLAAPADETIDALVGYCRLYAEAREWVITHTAADQDTAASLAERPGWQSVTSALSAGNASGVVTWTRSMLATSQEEWEQLASLIADRGGFLVAGALDTPERPLHPRHGPHAPRCDGAGSGPAEGDRRSAVREERGEPC
jgi:hypothetical protein